MGRIKSRDTVPELRVRRALHAAGLRFRLHAPELPGRPDIVFRSDRLALFVHGCFWHQHADPTCKRARMPKSRLEFWGPKLAGNRGRDARNRAELETAGWTVMEIWECSLDEPGEITKIIDEVRQARAREKLRKTKGLRA